MRVQQLSLFKTDDIPPAYAFAEYFILISPPAAVRKMIAGMKKALHKITPPGDENLHSIAHISLYKLRIPENDAFIIKKIRRALAHQHRFSIKLNGTEIFAHGNQSKTLVLKIANPEPINIIYALISREFRTSKRITPHLTIVRKISARNFEKINVQDFDHYEDFFCNEITILKKPEGKEHFDVLAKIPLLNTDHPAQKQPSGSSSAPA